MYGNLLAVFQLKRCGEEILPWRAEKKKSILPISVSKERYISK